VETLETVGGNEYWVTLSDSAIKGSEPVSDPLSDEAAWVYTQWLDVLAHTKDNANLVQNAIWYLEDEPGYTTANSLANAAVSAVTSGGWKNTNIMVMNLWTDYDDTSGIYSGNAQDHLVRIPVPAAVLLGILGLGVAGIKLRKYA
jgi:hypothetical protein